MENPGPKPVPDPDIAGLMSKEHGGSAADISPEIPIREELIEEVMQELYREISSNGPGPGVGVGPGPKWTAVAGSEVALTTSFEVGKSESCGASVSESASTVMAGIEYVAARGMWRESGDDDPMKNGVVEMDGCDDDPVKIGVVEMDGCDRGSDDDEWLARVLSWGPVEHGPWY